MVLKVEKKIINSSDRVHLEDLPKSTSLKNANDARVVVQQIAHEISDAYQEDNGLKTASVIVGVTTPGIFRGITNSKTREVLSLGHYLRSTLLMNSSEAILNTKWLVKNIEKALELKDKLKSLAERINEGFHLNDQLQPIFKRDAELRLAYSRILESVHSHLYDLTLKEYGDKIFKTTNLNAQDQKVAAILKQYGCVRVEGDRELIDLEKLQRLIRHSRFLMAEHLGQFLAEELFTNSNLQHTILKSPKISKITKPMSDLESPWVLLPDELAPESWSSLSLTLGELKEVKDYVQIFSRTLNPFSNPEEYGSIHEMISKRLTSDDLNLLEERVAKILAKHGFIIQNPNGTSGIDWDGFYNKIYECDDLLHPRFKNEAFQLHEANLQGYTRALNLTLSVGLPVLAAFGSTGQFVSLLENPYASVSEKSFSGLMASNAWGSFFLGAATYYAPTSRLGRLGASFLPIGGSLFTVLDAGIRVSFDKLHQEYGSPRARFILDTLLVATGPMGVYGGYLARTNPILGAMYIASSAGAAVASSVFHDSITRKGISTVLKKKIKEQIKIKKDDSHAGHTFPTQIDHHIQVAQAYGKFDDDTVFYLLDNLKGEQRNLDWRNDPFLASLRRNCIEALLEDARAYLSSFGDEEAAALLFFGLHSPDLNEQADAVHTFIAEVNRKDAPKVWSQFVSDYGLDSQKYGDLNQFFETMADDFTKNTYSSSFYGK